MSVIVFIPLSGGKAVTQVDWEDYDPMLRWRPFRVSKDNYAHTGRGDYLMGVHQIIANPLVTQDVDHINGDRLDNRRQNLRCCTRSQNCLNRKKAKNNTSGFKGVSLKSDGRSWVAIFCFEGVVIRRHGFKTKEDAARAYDALAYKYCREYALLNFPVAP